MKDGLYYFVMIMLISSFVLFCISLGIMDRILFRIKRITEKIEDIKKLLKKCEKNE